MQYRAFKQLAGDALRLGRRTAGAAAAGPLAVGKIMQRDHDRHNEAAGRRDATHAESELRGRFGRAHEARRGQAQATHNEQERKRQQLRSLEQQKRENAVERGDTIRKHKGAPPQIDLDAHDWKDSMLTGQADALKADLADPRYHAAERFLTTHGDGPLAMGEREFGAAVDQRRAELDLRPDDDVNLLSAGIDPAQHRANAAAAHGTAARATADRELAQSTAAMERDRELIGGLYDKGGDRYRTLRGENVTRGQEYRAARGQIRAERKETEGARPDLPALRAEPCATRSVSLLGRPIGAADRTRLAVMGVAVLAAVLVAMQLVRSDVTVAPPDPRDARGAEVTAPAATPTPTPDPALSRSRPRARRPTRRRAR